MPASSSSPSCAPGSPPSTRSTRATRTCTPAATSEVSSALTDHMTPLLDTGANAAMARRLFEHIDHTTCDLAPGQMLVAPAIYSDPEIARLEQERIFDRVPVLAAHVSQVPSAGAFVTMDLPGNRVLVVRPAAGGSGAVVHGCRP